MSQICTEFYKKLLQTDFYVPLRKEFFKFDENWMKNQSFFKKSIPTFLRWPEKATPHKIEKEMVKL